MSCFCFQGPHIGDARESRQEAAGRDAGATFGLHLGRHCSLFRAVSSLTHTQQTVLGFKPLSSSNTTKDTITPTRGPNTACASHPICSPMCFPSEVQHTITYKEKQGLLTSSQLCQSLTWCCSPEPSPPLSLSLSLSTTATPRLRPPPQHPTVRFVSYV